MAFSWNVLSKQLAFNKRPLLMNGRSFLCSSCYWSCYNATGVRSILKVGKNIVENRRRMPSLFAIVWILEIKHQLFNC